MPVRRIGPDEGGSTYCVAPAPPPARLHTIWMSFDQRNKSTVLSEPPLNPLSASLSLPPYLSIYLSFPLTLASGRGKILVREDSVKIIFPFYHSWTYWIGEEDIEGFVSYKDE